MECQQGFECGSINEPNMFFNRLEWKRCFTEPSNLKLAERGV